MPPLCYADNTYDEHLKEDPPTCEVTYQAIVDKFKHLHSTIKTQLTFEEEEPSDEEEAEQNDVDAPAPDSEQVVKVSPLLPATSSIAYGFTLSQSANPERAAKTAATKAMKKSVNSHTARLTVSARELKSLPGFGGSSLTIGMPVAT